MVKNKNKRESPALHSFMNKVSSIVFIYKSYHYSLHNPYFFLYANLTSITDDADLYIHHGHRTTAGAVVQSLHKLKDPNNNGKERSLLWTFIL